MKRRLPVVLWAVAVVCIVPAAVVNALLDKRDAIDLLDAAP